VHDVAGRHVARLFKGRLEAGAHEYTFESREQSAGIYFYTLRTARGTLSRSMILVR
jgi:hypothetical protein